MTEDDDSDSDVKINDVTLLAKREKRVLLISFWAGVFFVVVEMFVAIYSKSLTLLMDMAIDGTELVVVAASLLLAPLLYKPINEKHPFGYAQCESVFIIVKGFMILAVIISLVVSSIQTMLSGGNQVDTTLVAIFELLLSVFTFGFFLLLRYYSKKVHTPIINAEMLTWRLDTLSGLGLALAFILPWLLKNTAFAAFVPYLDQVVSLLLAATVMPGTVKMIARAVRSVLLFAPDATITEAIRSRAEEVLHAHGYEIVFADITKTGRKLWVSITFSSREPAISFQKMRGVYQELCRALDENFSEIDLELIPDWER